MARLDLLIGVLGEKAGGCVNAKIVYVTSQFPFGNGEIWAVEELLALVDQGLDVVVVPRTSSGEVLHARAKGLLARTLRAPFMSGAVLGSLLSLLVRRPGLFFELVGWVFRQADTPMDLAKGLFVLPKAVWVGKHLSGQGVRHVHSFSSLTVAVTGYVIARLVGAPWSFTMHTTATVHEGCRRSWHTHMASAAFVRPIAAQVAAGIVAFLGESWASKVRMHHLGVTLGARPLSQGARSRDVFEFVTPAAFLPHKGHEYALAAARLLLDRGFTGFRWRFFGDGPVLPRVRQMVAELGLQGVVELPGVIDNQKLRGLYREGAVDVMVLSSVRVEHIQEGIPVSLMEAMAEGIPVIATDSGGTLELIGDGAGVFVPQRDSQALAAALERFMTDAPFWQRQAQAGYEKIDMEFNACRIAAQFAEQLAGSTGPGAC
jgi:glycosyltransferase involved in cell wall biosynthesis